MASSSWRIWRLAGGKGLEVTPVLIISRLRLTCRLLEEVWRLLDEMKRLWIQIWRLVIEMQRLLNEVGLRMLDQGEERLTGQLRLKQAHIGLAGRTDGLGSGIKRCNNWW